MIKLNGCKKVIIVKNILFVSILILSSFLFGCNNNLDISSNKNEEFISSSSNSDLSEYRQEMEKLYVELKHNYENIKENKDLEEWEEFEKVFQYKLDSIEGKVFDTDLKYSVENLRNLYNEYDKELSENI